MKQSYVDACAFAIRVHGDQKRKYTGEPYWAHPIEVAGYVALVTDDEVAIQCALLHDLLEDTSVSYEELEVTFGFEVAKGVNTLSDAASGNREERKAETRRRLSLASGNIQSVKLADCISNGRSIIAYDPDFAVVYVSEVRALAAELTKGSPLLHRMLRDVLQSLTTVSERRKQQEEATKAAVATTSREDQALRDRFATNAPDMIPTAQLEYLLRNGDFTEFSRLMKALAKARYVYADEMLAARRNK